MTDNFQPLFPSSGDGFEPFDFGDRADDGFEPLPGFSRPGAKVPVDEDEEPGGDEVEASEPAEAPPEEPVPEASDVVLLKAREEAFEIGRKEGLEEGRVEIAGQLARVADLLKQLEGARREMAAQSVQDLASAIMHVSRAIVGRELQANSEGVENLVRSIFEDVQADDEVVVRVSEEDSWVMREAYPALLEMVGRDGEVRVLVDPTLKPGGAIVETSHGDIDASVEARFESFAAAIEGWVAQEVEVQDD